MDAAFYNLTRALYIAAAMALLRLGFTPSDLPAFASVRGYSTDEQREAA